MSIEAMKQALEALEMSRELEDRGLVDFQKYGLTKDKDILVKLELAITSLRQAIEQYEKLEPVTWLAPRYEGGHENLAVADQNEFGAFPVYTTPQPQREWVGLTDDEIAKVCGFGQFTSYSTQLTLSAVAKAIEAKLKERNT